MSEESFNQPTDSQKEQDGTKSGQFPRPKTKRKAAAAYLYEVFGALLLWAGFTIDNHWVSIAFTGSGILCCSFGLRSVLENYNLPHKTARNWSWLLLCAGVVAWIAIKVKPAEQLPEPPQPTPAPHLSLFVLPPENRPAIPMTNDFLILGKLRSSGTNGYWLGCLAIPVVSPAPARLELGIRNDSPIVPAESVEVTVIAGTNLVMSGEVGSLLHWQKVVTPGDDDGLQSSTALLGDILKSGRTLPALTFANAKDLIDQYLMFKVMLDARGMERTVVVFWIRFQASTNDGSPVLIPPTNWQR